MGRKAVGFYWTLPVPWAGFKALPGDVAEAAKASRTIRYQVERVRSFALDNALTLVREEVFLEIEPDRGSSYVVAALEKLEPWCRDNSAALLYVEFSEVQGWRSHSPMNEWSRRTSIETVPVPANNMMIDGKSFDPHEHFWKWRVRQQAWSDRKAERMSKARDRAAALRSEGASLEKISKALNSEQLRSATGKDWTGEMVRKLLNASAAMNAATGKSSIGS